VPVFGVVGVPSVVEVPAGRGDNPGDSGLDIGLVVGTSGGAINAVPIALGISRSEAGQKDFGQVWQELDQRQVVRPSALVRANIGAWFALLQTADRLNHRVYNVASGRVTTNAEVMAAVHAIIPGAATQLDLPAGRNPHSPAQGAYLDITRLSEDTGYVPEYGTEHAVADYVAWLRAGNEK